MTTYARFVLGVATLAALGLAPTVANAHFVLQTPAANFEQGGLGDPQKAPPCGDNGTAVATGMVTAYQGGDVVTITLDEAIYHKGHYRVALAINDPSELPEEPAVQSGDGWDCFTADIMDPPVFPVLADGMLLHDSPFDGTQSFDVVLPNDVSCTNCTLQVIQFMSEHGLNNPGGCFYHHCAQISIEPSGGEASATTPTEESGSEGGDESSTAGASTVTDATNASADEGDGTNGEDAGDASASATAATTAATTAGTGGGTDTDTAGSDDDDGGCSCTSGGGSPMAAMLGVIGLLGLRTRRRAA